MMNWPDFGVPNDPKQVLNVVDMFEQTLDDYQYSTGPIVVHCSAGVGRTGVFIAFMHIKEMLSRHKIPFDFSIKSVIKKLREQRYGMIQVNFSQIFPVDSTV